MTKAYPNSLCATKGHDWQLSMSGEFRVCGRERCRAMERLSQDQWVDARPKKYPAKNPLAKDMQQARQAQEQPRQLDFLAECKRSVPLEIGINSSEEQRQAELRYYRLLGR